MSSELPFEAGGEDVLAQDGFVIPAGIGAGEVITQVEVGAVAALHLQSAAGGEMEAVAGLGFAPGGAAFLVVPEGPACFAAQEEEKVVGEAQIERVAEGEGDGAQLLVKALPVV